MRNAWVLLGLCLGLLSGRSVAQEFRTEEEKTFFAEYQGLVGINDLLGVNKLVSSRGREAESVLEVLCNRYELAPSAEQMEAMRPLAVALDQDPRKKSEQFQTRLKYLEGLDAEGHGKRLEAIDKLVKAFATYDASLQSKDSNDYRRALLQLDEAQHAFAEIKDLEWLSLTRVRLGHCHDLLGELSEAVKHYDKAMDEWVGAGRSKSDQNYVFIKDRRLALIDLGYTPEGTTPTNVSGGPVKNTITAFVEGSEDVPWKTEYKLMKDPFQFATPSPFCSPFIFLWKQFTFDQGAHKLDHAEQNPCQPFGAPLKVVREGAKGMIDVNGDDKGDFPAKIIDGKPSAAELAAAPDKDAARYALWLVTGGQGQQWLGLQVNFQALGFYRPACYREGTVLGQKLILIDDNCSGTYGDAREARDGILRHNPSYFELDAMVVGKEVRPYSEVLGIDGKWHRVKIADLQASTLKTRELNLESGSVRLEWQGPVPPVSLVLREVRELQGAFFEVAGGKPMTVPVGRYEIAVGKIEAGKGNSVRQAWIFKGKSEPFEVKAGEETLLAMGGPYRFDFDTEDSGDKFRVKGKSLLIYEKTGALIGRVFPELVFPEVSVRTESGSVIAKSKPTRIVSSEQFNRDSVSPWFPADFEIDKPSGTRCQAQLSSTEKHKLLGGPFESEWK